MRKNFLIHKLGEIYMVVDFSGVGAKAQSVPSAQFTSWGLLEDYFLKLGAVQEALNKAKTDVESIRYSELAYLGQSDRKMGLAFHGGWPTFRF